jgi:hypothetical protein
MELVTKLAWGALIVIHLSPTAVLFVPGLTRPLYGVTPSGDVGVLLTHRGWLFGAVIAACTFAILQPETRRVSSLVTAISVLGFLVVYVRAGMPTGALRTVALTDLVALVPLGVVLYNAWWNKGQA